MQTVQELTLVTPARESDLPLLAGIEDAADRRFAERFGPLDRGASTPGVLRAARPGAVLVARTAGDGPPLGFAHVLLVGGAAHLEQLAVLPEAGGRGLGRALVRAVLRWAAERALPRVTLRTYADVPWNAPFCRTEGFQESEPDSGFLRGLVLIEAEAGLDRHGRRIQMTCDLVAHEPTDDEADEGDLGRVRTAAEVLRVARRAMEELLTAEELAASTASIVVPAPRWASDDDDLERVLRPTDRIGHGDRLLRVSVLGETSRTWLSSRWEGDDDALFALIRSDLQDFVAESAFGWGQLRE